jgi:DNA-binding HxlR family transcriptional regulator
MDGAFSILGKRWAAAILMEVLNGANRFNLLRTAVPDISPRTLSGRLDDLENVGLLRRQVTSSSPSRVHYVLTEKGEDMRTLLRELAGFSLKWYGQSHGE